MVSLRNTADLDDFNRAIKRLTAIADTVRAAQRVVFDLRAAGEVEEGFDWILENPGS